MYQELTQVEKDGIIAICELNRNSKRIEIVKEWTIGRIRIKFEWRSKKNLWGRFGGGWNWELGFQASGKTVILNLLIASLRIEIKKKKRQKGTHEHRSDNSSGTGRS